MASSISCLKRMMDWSSRLQDRCCIRFGNPRGRSSLSIAGWSLRPRPPGDHRKACEGGCVPISASSPRAEVGRPVPSHPRRRSRRQVHLGPGPLDPSTILLCKEVPPGPISSSPRRITKPTWNRGLNPSSKARGTPTSSLSSLLNQRITLCRPRVQPKFPSYAGKIDSRDHAEFARKHLDRSC